MISRDNSADVFDDVFNKSASLEDLSTWLIHDYLKETNHKLLHDFSNLSLEELSLQMNIARYINGRLLLKNVALLFFSESPEMFFPGTQANLVSRAKNKLTRKEFKGSLKQIIRDSVHHINNLYLSTKVVKHSDRPEAERFDNFPLEAVKEAVIHAFCHRSYENTHPVEIEVTPKYISVLSCPSLDDSLRMEELEDGKIMSNPHINIRVEESFKKLGLKIVNLQVSQRYLSL